MTISEFVAQTEYHQHEHELVERLERRRVVEERAVARTPSERLALVAAMARIARAAR